MPNQLDRIKEKLVRVRKQGLRSFGDEGHRFESAPLPLKEVQKWELTHGIQLPVGFRSFLTEIGPGAGPYYGVFPLSRWDEFISGFLDQTPEDTLTHPSQFEPGPNLVDEALAYDEESCPYKGLIAIGHQGCAGYVLLVVCGSHAGRVVYSDMEQLNTYMCRDESFLDWYERWLDEMLDGFDVTWFGYVPGGSEAHLWGMIRAEGADLKLKREVVFAFKARPTLSAETLDELEKLADNPDVQVQVMSALGKHAPERVQSRALSLLNSSDRSTQLAAVRALDLSKVGAEPLISLVLEEDSDVGLAAFFRIQSAELMSASLRRRIIMDSKCAAARSQAAWRFEFSADDPEVILTCLRDRNAGVILQGLGGARLLDPEKALAELERILEEGIAGREGAIRVAGRLDHPGAGDIILRFLDDQDDFVRLAALEALAELGDERLRFSAKQMLKEDRVPYVRTNSGSRTHSKTIAQLAEEILRQHGFKIG